MNDYVLFTDSDCDLSSETAAKAGYFLISMPYLIGETCICPWEDFTTFDAHAFYDLLRSGTVPTTCSVNTERYMEYFEPVFASGKDIVYVHFSNQMSSTLQNMALALERLKERYSQRRLYAIDTLSASACARNVALAIADLAAGGASPEELVAWSEREVEHFVCLSVLDDLKYLVRGGRLPGFTGSIAQVLGVKPIVYVDTDGITKSCAKARGRHGVLRYLLGCMQALAFDPEKYRVIISHADAQEAARDLEKAILGAYGDVAEILIDNINPTVGCHLGPGAMVLSFYGSGRKPS